MERTRTTKTALYLAIVALAMFLEACSVPTKHERQIVRPRGQVLLATIEQGVVDGIAWQAEIVRQGGDECVQVIVFPRIMDAECGFETNEKIPVNLEIVGNKG